MPENERPATAPLFDAVAEVVHNTYGSRAEPKIVTIATHTGLEVSFAVPLGWEPSVSLPIIRGADCFAEVLTTIIQCGHRLTRAALLDEMQRLGRKRAESTVCLALEDLMRLGIINNKQTPGSKGYGCPSWED